MRADNGRWVEAVDRDGSVIRDVRENAMGRLFAAYGLAEYYKAAKNGEDQDIVFETLWAALRAYDGLNYSGVPDYGGMRQDTGFNGLRELGHTTLVIRLLSGFLEHTRNRRLEEVLEEHIVYVMESFFNPKLGILNAYLNHDYTRIAGYEDYMQTGAAVIAAWTVMTEAQRSRDTTRFEDALSMIKRFLEMGWDYVFDGFGDGNLYVFDGPDRTRDALYSEKTMRSHCELSTAVFHIFEYTGDPWAKSWYERIRAYTIQKFADISPVWPDTVDRFGRVAAQPGGQGRKRDIFHQPRYLMLNLLALDRLLEKLGKLEDIEAAP